MNVPVFPIIVPPPNHVFNMDHASGKQTAKVYLLPKIAVIAVTGVFLDPKNETEFRQLHVWYCEVSHVVPDESIGLIVWPDGRLQLMPPKNSLTPT